MVDIIMKIAIILKMNFSRSKMGHPSLFQKILAAFCSFLLTVSLLEMFVRVRDYVKASKEELVWTGERQFLNIRSRNPRLVYEYKPNTITNLFGTEIKTNEFGYRDYAYSRAKPPMVKRVAVVGDSIAFGFRVELDQTYAKILEKQLNAAGRHFEVLNMGVAGYNTSQEAELFKTRGIYFEPDVVVWNYSLNDKDLFADGGLSGYMMKTATPLHILGLLQYKWMKYREAKTDLGKRQVISGLDELKSICEVRHIPVVVMVHPMFRDAWPKEKVSEEINWIRKLSLDRHFYFLDLSPLFADKNPENVSWDALHPNVLGHQMTAEALKRFLTEKSLLKS